MDISEALLNDGYRLDQEVNLVQKLLLMSERRKGIINDLINSQSSCPACEEALVLCTRELSAIRARVCGIMLRSIADTFSDRGSSGIAKQLLDLSEKLGLTALQFARENNLPWGREVLDDQ